MPTAHDMFSKPDPAYTAFCDDNSTYAVIPNGNGRIPHPVSNPDTSAFVRRAEDVQPFVGFYIPAFLVAASGADPNIAEI